MQVPRISPRHSEVIRVLFTLPSAWRIACYPFHLLHSSPMLPEIQNPVLRYLASVLASIVFLLILEGLFDFRSGESFPERLVMIVIVAFVGSVPTLFPREKRLFPMLLVLILLVSAAIMWFALHG